MQIIKRRIVVGTGADGWSPKRNRQIEPVRATADVVHLVPLNVHATDEDGLRPLEIFFAGSADVLVDEPDRPVGRQIGRDQQESLRGHEGLNAVGQRIGMFERAERGRIAGKDAQDTAYGLRAFSSHSSLCASKPDQYRYAAEGSTTNSSGLWQSPNPPVNGWLQGNNQQGLQISGEQCSRKIG